MIDREKRMIRECLLMKKERKEVREEGMIGRWEEEESKRTL